jgi:hypothetical protein
MLLVIAPFAAHADEGIHLGFVGGLGLAQGQIGGHVELRKGHVEIFAGTGTIYSTTLDTNPLGPIGDSFGGSGYGAVAGARWFSGESGDRLFLSTQFGFSVQQTPGDPQEGFPSAWVHSNATTMTAGWRFKWGAFLVDAGAGGGVVFKNGDHYQAHLTPDFTLAAGFEL